MFYSRKPKSFFKSNAIKSFCPINTLQTDTYQLCLHFQLSNERERRLKLHQSQQKSVHRSIVFHKSMYLSTSAFLKKNYPSHIHDLWKKNIWYVN